jgi:hypothetical protein
VTRPKLLLALLGVGLLAATVAGAPALTQASSPRRTLYVAKSVNTLPRTTFVRARDCVRRPRTCVNGLGGLELVYLTKGKLPATPTTAKVLTDTNCAADRNGISHCSNILQLASGRMITVRHDHSMMSDPCLSPGERVRVRPLR